MNHDDDLIELELLDERANAAAAGLRRHVSGHLDREGFPPLTMHPHRRRTGPSRRVAAVAAAVLLAVGAISVVNRGDDGRQRVDMDELEALPDLEGSALTPLGPRDGKDSVRLPIVVEPATGITDGQTVAVSGDGFLPGEAVGIVQCAREAGGDSPETRGGADGCNIGRFEQVTADEQGHAEGTFVVQRVLTTPLTGTIDCAAEAQRCMVAMGAISDYDRSGAMPIEMAAGGEPIEIPTVTVTPNEGLGDGDIVRVTVEGVTPDDFLYIEICSSDPMACWSTGEHFERTMREGSQEWVEASVGLQADASGRAEGDIPVWRFLPGDAAGTYVDCAVSRCSLRVGGATAPPTVPLRFNGGGEPPTAPQLAAEPTDGLAPGDEVVVRGAGFGPNQPVNLMLCGGPAEMPGAQQCGFSGGETVTDADGELLVPFEIPELSYCMGECRPTDMVELTCDGVVTRCWIGVDWWPDPEGKAARPHFQPAPVFITFR